MNIHLYTWIITIVVLVGVLVFDAVVIGRKPHVPSPKECTRWILLYVSLAILFGIGIWRISGAQYGQEFFAGWLTEYSLSMDNLFIFLIIMEKQRVPRELQQFALMIGIMLALVFRGVFIGVGAVLIANLAWVFFIFGVFLLYTAWGVLKDFRSGEDESEHTEDGAIARFVKSHVPTTNTWEGDRLLVRRDGHLKVTLIFFVVVTLGSTDVMFALDSIPAIFGLTREPFIVFTANVFALMGLRQLYFLLGDLLEKLYYLPVGLFFLLGFIGVKLVLHAMNHYEFDARLGVVGTLLALLILVAAVFLCWILVKGIALAWKRARDGAEPAGRASALVWLLVGAVVATGVVFALRELLGRMDGVASTAKVSFNGEIPTMASLGGIVLILGTTAVISVLKARRDLAKVAPHLG